jgi:hypothetical protein
MVENGGGGWKGNNRDVELIGTKKKEEKPTYMGEEPP